MVQQTEIFVAPQDDIQNAVLPLPRATVTILEAEKGSANAQRFCVQTFTFYLYVASGGAYTVDHTKVLSTGDGGNTRWVGVAGKYVAGEVNAQSLAAQEGVSGGSVTGGAVIASEDGDTAQLDALGVITANSQEIDLKVLPVREVVQAASDTLTADECRNTIVNNYGQSQANTQTLPTAVEGLSVFFFIATSGMGAFNVKAGPNDKIYLDGTALDDGDKVALATPAVGNCACAFTVKTGASAYDWYFNTITGVWTDGGA